MKKRTIFISLFALLLVSSLTVMTFAINNQAIGFTSSYTVTFDSAGGSAIRSIRVKSGEKIKKPDDPQKKGYSLNQWLNGDAPFSFEKDFVTKDVTLTADWDCVNYKINYDFDGGSIDGDYATSYNIESDIDLVDPVKEDSLFLGWFDESDAKVSSIDKGNTGDISLRARWIDDRKIVCDDPDGDISFDFDGDDYTTLVVQNNPDNGKMHLFKGWYNQNGELLSENQEMSIGIEDLENMTLHAEYYSDEEETQWDIEHGFRPVYLNEEHTRVRYGFYPKDNVNDEELIQKLENAEINKENGYYYYNHEYYYKRVAHLYYGNESEYRQFNNGDLINEGSIYWFKVEPLTWKVLETNGDNLLLVSEIVTEAHRYFTSYKMREIDGKTIYPNNYEYSEMRSWLNNEFLNTAFCFDNSYIQTHIIDNSLDTLYSCEEKYVSPNTYDKVFPLSYRDFADRFTVNERKIDATDVFMASGGLYGMNGNDFLKSYLFTRSPATTDGYSVSKINRSGGINTSDGGADYCGTLPAIYIDLIE